MVKRYEITGHDWYPSEEATGPYVTHADYRALEDENGRLKDKLADYEDLCTERNTEIQHLREELASIKARVGDVEKKDPDICNREYANGWNACRLALDVPK